MIQKFNKKKRLGMEQIMVLFLVGCLFLALGSSMILAADNSEVYSTGQFPDGPGGEPGAFWRLYDDGSMVIEEGHVSGVSEPLFYRDHIWQPYRSMITQIFIQGPVTAGEDMRFFFGGPMPLLTCIHGLYMMDTSQTTSLESMFESIERVTSLDLSSWDVSNVTNMRHMFRGNIGLKELNISSWDVSNVTNMQGMFSGVALREIDTADWDTRNVTNMSGMFSSATGLEELDVSGWDTSNVTTMSDMFSGASSLREVDVSGWDVSNVLGFNNMFSQASSLTEIDVSRWNPSRAGEMVGMFFGVQVTSLDVSQWRVNPILTQGMFQNASNLTSLDLSNWNIGSHVRMSSMLAGTYALRELKLGEGFQFVTFWRPDLQRYEDASVPNSPSNEHFTGYWQNVGLGTVDNPLGAFVLTSQELMDKFEGSVMSDTWVWQPRRQHTITFHMYTTHNGIFDTFLEHSSEWVDERPVLVVTVIPGTARDGWEGLEDALAIGNIYGAFDDPGHAFWGWFTDETLTASTRMRGELRRPALGDECEIEEKLTLIEAATASTAIINLFGDEAGGNIDLFAVWSLWGDVDDNDVVESEDLELFRRFLQYGPLGLTVHMNHRAADVIVDGNILDEDWELIRKYLQYGLWTEIILGQAPQ